MQRTCSSTNTAGFRSIVKLHNDHDRDPIPESGQTPPILPPNFQRHSPLLPPPGKIKWYPNVLVQDYTRFVCHENYILWVTILSQKVSVYFT